MTILDLLYLYVACGVTTALGMAVAASRRMAADWHNRPVAPHPIPEWFEALVFAVLFCVFTVFSGLAWPLFVSKLVFGKSSR